MHPEVVAVTERLRERSRVSRAAYLVQMAQAPAGRSGLSCGNLAHGMAACSAQDKARIRMIDEVNIGMVSAYNDMLSAHQPYERYPQLLRDYLRSIGATGQVAGGVPAMCDGVTQGEPGMELSLASRDVIAMGTAVALSHNMFNGVLCFGICDKIVPGLLLGALRFGHLPVVFVPSGPMPSGLPNSEKVRVRQLYAEGKVDREQLLAAESASYHSPGTCTFYGTANTNQMLLEAMGLQLPGASFVAPDTPLRDALSRAAAKAAVTLARAGEGSLSQVLDERALINAVVMLLATGGSTNLTLHLVAIGQAAGLQLRWEDMADLSRVVPTLAHIYPSGKADINQFQAAGGTAWLFRELLTAGLLHEDVQTVAGAGLSRYCQEPYLHNGELAWRDGPQASLDSDVLRPVSAPFAADGGLRMLDGELGRGVVKVSAVAPEHRQVTAPCRVFDSQEDFVAAFQAGELARDLVAVVRFQGPAANGMPELHRLMPYLGALQDKGHRVALVTDGRLSGASGKVPAAIHLCPEALQGGAISRLQDGDVLSLDADAGTLQVQVEGSDWQQREQAACPQTVRRGWGRELFAFMRAQASSAELGGCVFTAGLHEADQ
ncbi:phosphogluconate dehydratase [Halopseudomonas pachastrellae]|uniref:Phosphogluconate dehydratase n=1 Tax=Halopseudomonas pachastrellae TaxID=254161 RepID=A0A1S8DHJ6_9GAMM|nr:phosphogluconate dehydratase [Halopseudomonas pachastrellae]ONM44070.1 phosphogluconate dehydratase [Halopseudomonas pachastrellae]SFM62213.1 6-phosphogluconate dehydratase [Halopseudomonas pachastrellae]